MNNNMIQISVVIFHRKETITINIQPVDTIATVKIKIQSKIGINLKHQELVYGDQILYDEITLKSYNIDNIGRNYKIIMFRQQKESYIIFFRGLAGQKNIIKVRSSDTI